MRLKLLFSLTAILFFAISASAQKYEVSVSVGGMGTGDRDIVLPVPGIIDVNKGLAYQVNFSQRFFNAHLASLHFEFPITVTPRREIDSSNALLPRSYSSLFITPGVKVKLLPGAGISPYAVAGVGYARFNSSDFLVNDQPNQGDRTANRAVFDFGGGVDLKVLPFISVRGEVRDFVSGNPRFNAELIGNRQHNLLISGGIVFRF